MAPESQELVGPGSNLPNPEEVLKKIPQQQRDQVRALIYQRSHSGPLPVPEDLGQYNNIIENGAERIMQMAERNQAHRISQDATSLHAEIRLAQTGQILGFLLAVSLIAVGAWTAFIGQAPVSIAIFSTTVVGLAATFVWRKKSEPEPAPKSRKNRR